MKTTDKKKINSLGGSDASRDISYIIHPCVFSERQVYLRDTDLIIEEVEGLARAIGLNVSAVKIFNVSRIKAGSFLGKGQIEAVSLEIEELQPRVIIFNSTLSPIQQRNLEREWGVKVIDRTGLILEIFGERAQTKEGRLQVELAAMEYQKSRLVRSWTHLERQRGGAGFMGGPGEAQIEIDRRLISGRIIKLKKELNNVRRTRDLGRKSRERVPFPIIALVGYTNAGKSTLFNYMTGAKVFAEDLPFATLDPTMRRIELPGGQNAILSDTVGFISDLPTHLIESFRATLEQINYAEVIIHVIDISSPDYEAQRLDVIKVLSDLGIDYESDDRIIEAWNKIDLLDNADQQEIERQIKFKGASEIISAINGQGIESIIKLAGDIVSKSRVGAQFCLSLSDGKALSWLYEHCQMLERKDQDEYIAVKVMIAPEDLGRFTEAFNYQPVIADNKKSKEKYGDYRS